jgi:hypothetical protein
MRRLTGTIGAKVAGISFNSPLDEATFGKIPQAFLEHCLFWRAALLSVWLATGPALAVAQDCQRYTFPATPAVGYSTYGGPRGECAEALAKAKRYHRQQQAYFDELASQAKERKRALEGEEFKERMAGEPTGGTKTAIRSTEESIRGFERKSDDARRVVSSLPSSCVCAESPMERYQRLETERTAEREAREAEERENRQRRDREEAERTAKQERDRRFRDRERQDKQEQLAARQKAYDQEQADRAQRHEEEREEEEHRREREDHWREREDQAAQVRRKADYLRQELTARMQRKETTADETIKQTAKHPKDNTGESVLRDMTDPFAQHGKHSPQPDFGVVDPFVLESSKGAVLQSARQSGDYANIPPDNKGVSQSSVSSKAFGFGKQGAGEILKYNLGGLDTNIDAIRKELEIVSAKSSRGKELSTALQAMEQSRGLLSGTQKALKAIDYALKTAKVATGETWQQRSRRLETWPSRRRNLSLPN